MNNKCNNCAKFLTCDRKKCEKITFVEAEILDKPKKIKRNYIQERWKKVGVSMLEAEENLTKAMKEFAKKSQYSK